MDSAVVGAVDACEKAVSGFVVRLCRRRTWRHSHRADVLKLAAGSEGAFAQLKASANGLSLEL